MDTNFSATKLGVGEFENSTKITPMEEALRDMRIFQLELVEATRRQQTEQVLKKYSTNPAAHVKGCLLNKSIQEYPTMDCS